MGSKGIKGYGIGLICRGKQYAENMIYEEDVKPSCFNQGMHFVKNPLEVFNYYKPVESEYTEVEALGDIDNHNDDSKVSTNKIKIGLKIGIEGIIKAGNKFIFEKTKSSEDTVATTGNYSNAATTGEYSNAATTGNYSNAATTCNNANAATTGVCSNAATNSHYANAVTTGNFANAATTGYRSNAATAGDCSNAVTTWDRANAATTGICSNAAATGNYSNAATTGICSNAAATGNYSNAATTGDNSKAEAKGKNSIAAAIGKNSMAKAAINNWIVLSEWYQDNEWNWCVKEAKTAVVDGEKIKADTWYKLKNGEFVESTEEYGAVY